MDVENVKHAEQDSAPRTIQANGYDPFGRGQFPVGVRTVQAFDISRDRLFPCEIWYPATVVHSGQDISPATCDHFKVQVSQLLRRQTAVRDAAVQSGTFPLIIFSHHSGGSRRMATFLCTHLSSHGYLVAALDHSEVIAQELGRKCEETDQQKSARIDAWISNRVPDVRFLLSHLLSRGLLDLQVSVDPSRIGIVGHSFGGWTALASVETESRIRAVVALAPGGSSNPRSGIIPAQLNFNWARDVPTLYLVAENDVSVPLAGAFELFDRTQSTKQMVILRRADHMHFMDNVEEMHEVVRAMKFEGELAWLSKEMRPIAELCSGERAHLFVRGMTLCHMDATLRRQYNAIQFLSGDVRAELANRGVDAIVP